MDVDKIRIFVEELDELVPEDGAAVRLDQYGGGPDESQIVANQAGLLRLGIELLKTGLIPSTQKPKEWKKGVALDFEGLVLEDSTVQFDWCEFQKDLGVEPPPPRSLFDRMLPIGCLMVLLTVLLFSFVGVGTFLGLAAGWIE